MVDNQQWQSELEEYIRQGEPSAKEKSVAWKTAIGLQQVDGLNTSAYLLDTAKEHIEGKISIHEAQKRIHNYYKVQSQRAKLEEGSKVPRMLLQSAKMTLWNYPWRSWHF